MSLQEMTFGQNDSNYQSKKKAWKAKAGETYAASFVFLKDLEKGVPDFTHRMPRFVGAESAWVDGVGNVIFTPEIKLALPQIKPRPRVGTIIALWPLTSDQEVDTQALHRVEILPWIFSADKYEDLKRIHKNFNLVENDILITCENSEFQKMKFMPKPKGLLYQLGTSEKAQHKEFVTKIFDKARNIQADFESYLGSSYTLAALREKMGARGGPGVPAPSIPDNLDESVSNFLES